MHENTPCVKLLSSIAPFYGKIRKIFRQHRGKMFLVMRTRKTSTQPVIKNILAVSGPPFGGNIERNIPLCLSRHTNPLCSLWNEKKQR